jgi:hypothetical protein
MDKLLDFWLMFLTQIAGGPGPAGNNLVRFALPAIFWAVFMVAAAIGHRPPRPVSRDPIGVALAPAGAGRARRCPCYPGKETGLAP